MNNEQKDFSSVSPSARSLLMMKAYTDIPYAKEAAALVQGPEAFGLTFDDKDFWFLIRVMHFESRYKSIDQLMQEAGGSNILELSSGYSFRGLDLCKKNSNTFYVDTDLPEVTEIKQRMINELQLAEGLLGKFELLPLNVMDVPAFDDIIRKFSAGPLTIINEGLLMYLNLEEKKHLCRMIHKTLKEKGGCWITADIYVKLSEDVKFNMPKSGKEAAFFEQHNIEDNKFDSYEAAEEFFMAQGLELVKEAEPNFREMSIVPSLMKVLPEQVKNSNEAPPKMQATWMLRAV